MKPKIPKPDHGWFEAMLRFMAAVAIGMGVANLAAGPSGDPWYISWVALAFGMIAVSGVERLRRRVADLERRPPVNPEANP